MQQWQALWLNLFEAVLFVDSVRLPKHHKRNKYTRTSAHPQSYRSGPATLPFRPGPFSANRKHEKTAHRAKLITRTDQIEESVKRQTAALHRIRISNKR